MITVPAISIPENPIATGAYAAVYAVDDQTEYAAKLYRPPWPHVHPSRRKRREQKIREMCAMPAPSTPAHTRVAWPVEPITELGATNQEESVLIGYLMPKAPADAVGLLELTDSDLAEHALAALQEALRQLHEQSVVFGDVNQNNVAVTKAGELWLYDTDSWQFTDASGALHHAEGSTTGFTPPTIAARLQGTQRNCINPKCPRTGAVHPQSVDCSPRTPASDNYAVAQLARLVRRKFVGSRPATGRHLH